MVQLKRPSNQAAACTSGGAARDHRAAAVGCGCWRLRCGADGRHQGRLLDATKGQRGAVGSRGPRLREPLAAERR